MERIAVFIDRIKNHHWPNRPATEIEIAITERELIAQLPSDLHEFYLHCNGAILFDRTDPPFKILPVSELRPVIQAVFGTLDVADCHCPVSIVAFCALHDSEFLGIDLDRTRGRFGWILDCFHGTVCEDPYGCIVAKSFTEFLARAIDSGGGTSVFWL